MKLAALRARCAATAVSLAALGACVSRPPTLAHVHLGHAVTGVRVTPDHKGYLSVAEERAGEARQAAENAVRETDLKLLKSRIVTVLAATDSTENFGVKQSIVMTANHLAFAAASADASANVVRFAPVFARDIEAVVARCDYIVLLGKDVASSRSLRESKVITEEIAKLTRANLDGEASRDGSVGADPAKYGLAQLREEVQAMIAHEIPPYRAVDTRYLFNLVRLPNGRWVFDNATRGGNIDGYK